MGTPSNRKNPHAHKNKIGTSKPPLPNNHDPPPPQNEEFYGHGGFPGERTKKCQAPTKLAQPFLAPEFHQPRNHPHHHFGS